MCGIAGYWKVKPSNQFSLLKTMSHRGPDGSGQFSSGNVTLFHTRLAVIDLSLHGAQPMNHNSGVTITYNGEIYNHRELRDELIGLGYTFKSQSDTEVVLLMYVHYGISCLSRLRGMFALAIYDESEGVENSVLFLVRDHFGIKPLHYATLDSGLVFASEIRTILDSKLVKKTIDVFSVRELLAVGSIYQPRTICQDIKSVMPGRYLQINNAGIAEITYWSPEKEIPIPLESSLADAVKTADTILNDSLSTHVTSDLEIGALLSGGLDSSLLTSMLKRNHLKNLSTFTVGFESKTQKDERKIAADFASHLKTDHHEITLSESKLELSFLKFVSALDQPTMDGFNSFLVSQAVSKYVSVAISGTGGDELFAGYPWFSKTRNSSVRSSSRMISRLAHRYPGIFYSIPRLPHIIDNDSIASMFSFQNLCFGYERACRLVPHSALMHNSYSESFLDFESRDLLKNDTTLNRLTAICLSGYTRNQLLRDIDSVSMHFSLELRLPLIDKKVYDFSRSLPDFYKIGKPDELAAAGSYSAKGEKFILAQLSSKYIPDEILNRPKQGFQLPIEDWLSGPLSKLLNHELSREQLASFHFLDSDEIISALDEFKSGKLAAIKIWTILVLVIWIKMNIYGKDSYLE
jgi:asparagine synthase (glutamine-hydrolysing)